MLSFINLIFDFITVKSAKMSQIVPLKDEELFRINYVAKEAICVLVKRRYGLQIIIS